MKNALNSKRILFLFAFLSYSIQGNAQFINGYSFGISGNYTTVASNQVEGFRNYAPGIGLGGYISHSLKEHLNLLIGLESIVRRVGSDRVIQVRDEQGEVNGEYRSKFTSSLFLISIPVLLEINTPSKFFGRFGPRLDFKTGFINGETEVETESGKFRDNDSLFENAETFNYGISVGLGRRFFVNDRRINIELRYNNDFAELIRKREFISLQKQSFDLWISLNF